MRLEIHQAIPTEYARIAELTQRTNRCTNGRRYTVMQIKERMHARDVFIYSVFLSDRYSNLGLVGALEVEDNVLTLFSLSCRALGRGIEKSMIQFLNEHHHINRIEFKTTGKNDDVRLFLADYFIV